MNHLPWDKDVIKCFLSSAYFSARVQEQLNIQRTRVLKRGAGFISKQFSPHVHRAQAKKSFKLSLSQSCQYFWNKGPIFGIYSTKLPSHSYSGSLHLTFTECSHSNEQNPRRHLECSVIRFLLCFYFS